MLSKPCMRVFCRHWADGAMWHRCVRVVCGAKRYARFVWRFLCHSPFSPMWHGVHSSSTAGDNRRCSQGRSVRYNHRARGNQCEELDGSAGRSMGRGRGRGGLESVGGWKVVRARIACLGGGAFILSSPPLHTAHGGTRHTWGAIIHKISEQATHSHTLKGPPRPPTPSPTDQRCTSLQDTKV